MSWTTSSGGSGGGGSTTPGNSTKKIATRSDINNLPIITQSFFESDLNKCLNYSEAEAGSQFSDRDVYYYTDVTGPDKQLIKLSDIKIGYNTYNIGLTTSNLSVSFHNATGSNNARLSGCDISLYSTDYEDSWQMIGNSIHYGSYNFTEDEEHMPDNPTLPSTWNSTLLRYLDQYWFFKVDVSASSNNVQCIIYDGTTLVFNETNKSGTFNANYIKGSVSSMGVSISIDLI